MGAPVVHWEINSRDAGRAQEFYSNLFGWTVNADNPMRYGLVHTGVEMGINGGIGQTQDGMPPSVIFYVQVEELQSYLDKAVQMGGRIIMPVTEVPDMVTMALFADPEGNVIGLVKGPQTPPPPPRKTRARRSASTKTAARSRTRVKSRKATRKPVKKSRRR
jgi:predicted enzyme related to lactoylglutathione lyase